MMKAIYEMSMGLLSMLGYTAMFGGAVLGAALAVYVFGVYALPLWIMGTQLAGLYGALTYTIGAMFMLGGAFVSACAGGIVGFWVGYIPFVMQYKFQEGVSALVSPVSSKDMASSDSMTMDESGDDGMKRVSSVERNIS